MGSPVGYAWDAYVDFEQDIEHLNAQRERTTRNMA